MAWARWRSRPDCWQRWVVGVPPPAAIEIKTDEQIRSDASGQSGRGPMPWMRLPRRSAPGSPAGTRRDRRGGHPLGRGGALIPRASRFPASICVSIDNAIVHGIPNDRARRCAGLHRPRAIWTAGTATPPSQFRSVTSVAGAGVVGWTRSAMARRRACADRRPPDRCRSRSGAVVRCGSRNYGIVRDYVGHGSARRCTWRPDVPGVGPAGQGASARAGNGAGRGAHDHAWFAGQRHAARRVDSGHDGRSWPRTGNTRWRSSHRAVVLTARDGGAVGSQRWGFRSLGDERLRSRCLATGRLR